MPAPATSAEFLALVQKSGVVDPERLEAQLEQLRVTPSPNGPKELARRLVEDGLITYFQAEHLLQGKWRGFTVGKYQILERIGSGGMGVVYLAEHKLLRRRVALKVLPLNLAQDPWFLERFYREAQAIAALDHPNIVHAHDIDQDGNLHFLVMEYVDGSSFQAIVSKHGPMAVPRVPHYLRQAALGLQHAHEAGLVHRDMKPGNLLLDRQGIVKVLDLGLAHFLKRVPAEVFASNDTAKRIVGTDDYLAPEQIVDSDDVDIRADIYSLGATAYFLLTGHPPFHDVPDQHKFIWHITRRPKPVRERRPDVPEELSDLLGRMMAKNPWERFRTPAEVAEALVPWTQTPIPPPPAAEMPGLCPAAQRLGAGSSTTRRTPGRSSWVICNGPPRSGAGASLVPTPANPQAQTPTETTPATPRAGDTAKQEKPGGTA